MADLVLPSGENGVIKMSSPAPQGAKRPAVRYRDDAVRLVDMTDILRPFPANERQITTGNHGPFPVDYTHDPVSGFFYLQDNVLKNSS